MLVLAPAFCLWEVCVCSRSLRMRARVQGGFFFRTLGDAVVRFVADVLKDVPLQRCV